ncbi:conserved domain protein, partial [Trichinella spiralis]
MVQAVATG